MAKEHQSEEIINQRYKITHVLGKGGVGITYSAIDLRNDSTVAIKAVSLRQLDDWKQVELFEREARVLAKLDHPHIPRYLDYFDIETEKDKVFYIVQQLAPGKSLFQLVESGWRTTEAEVKQIAEQILLILTYLHAQDPPIIHRDIKPHNLIRSDDGKIFLVDFGAVQNTYYDTLMQGSTVVGTYGYMAPEQFRGKAEPATDLYSLGATLLYLLTHRSPSELPQNALKLNFKSQVNISESFSDWLDKILEPDIEDRFKTAKESLSKLYRKKPVAKSRNTARKLIAFLMFALIGASILKLNEYKFDILLKSEYYQNKICNNTKFAKKYINKGKDINANLSFDENTKSFLSCLIGKNDPELFELLTVNNASIKDIKTYNTIMFFKAIFDEDLDTAKQLLTKEIDVNTRFYKISKCERYGRFCSYYYCPESTALYQAIIRKNLDIVKLLVDNGAELNESCQAYRTNTIQHDDLITPLSKAIDMGNTEIVNFLIVNGADVSSTLMPFTLSRRILNRNISDYKIIKILLENGLDPTVENSFVRNEYLSDIDPSVRNRYKDRRRVKYNSLLHFAEARQRYEIVSLFNQYADRNTKLDNK